VTVTSQQCDCLLPGTRQTTPRPNTTPLSYEQPDAHQMPDTRKNRVIEDKTTEHAAPAATTPSRRSARCARPHSLTLGDQPWSRTKRADPPRSARERGSVL